MTITSESPYQALPHDAPAIDTEEDTQPELLIVDVQTRYIFFVLGCALLLPWNGILLPKLDVHTSHTDSLNL